MILRRFAFAFFLLCPALLSAQVAEPRSTLSVGGSAGIGLNSVDFDPTIKQGLLVTPTFGATMRYTCEKYFTMVCALQVELNFAQLGWKEDIYDRANNPLPDTYQHTISYIQMPLLARLGWGREEHGFMGYIVMGPQLGYCIDENSKRSDTWTLNSDGKPNRPNNVFQQYDLKVQNKFDYGITAGAGCELSTALGRFDIEARYYYGLGDLYKNGKKEPFSRSANQSIIIKAAYFLDLHK